MPNPLEGPYSAENGIDAYGHIVNGYGRCKPLNDGYPNEPPLGCPSRAERAAELLNLTFYDIGVIASGMGITIPAGLAVVVHPILVNLILAAEGYTPA